MKKSIHLFFGLCLAACLFALPSGAFAQGTGNGNAGGNGNGNGATPTSSGVNLPSQNNGQGFSNGQGHLNGNSNVASCLGDFESNAVSTWHSTGFSLDCIQRLSPTQIWIAGVGGDCSPLGTTIQAGLFELNGCDITVSYTYNYVPGYGCNTGNGVDDCSRLANAGIQP